MFGGVIGLDMHMFGLIGPYKIHIWVFPYLFVWINIIIHCLVYTLPQR